MHKNKNYVHFMIIFALILKSFITFAGSKCWSRVNAYDI